MCTAAQAHARERLQLSHRPSARARARLADTLQASAEGQHSQTRGSCVSTSTGTAQMPLSARLHHAACLVTLCCAAGGGVHGAAIVQPPRRDQAHLLCHAQEGVRSLALQPSFAPAAPARALSLPVVQDGMINLATQGALLQLMSLVLLTVVCFRLTECCECRQVQASRLPSRPKVTPAEQSCRCTAYWQVLTSAPLQVQLPTSSQVVTAEGPVVQLWVHSCAT